MTCRLYHHQQKKGIRGAGVDLQKWEEPKLGVEDARMIWSVTKKCGPKGK